MQFEDFDVQTAVVCCEPSGRKVTVVWDTHLLDALLQVGMPVSQACDGVAMCGFCRVQVIEGEENLTPMESEERKILASLHADDDERLACCARVTGPVTRVTTHRGETSLAYAPVAAALRRSLGGSDDLGETVLAEVARLVPDVVGVRPPDGGLDSRAAPILKGDRPA